LNLNHSKDEHLIPQTQRKINAVKGDKVHLYNLVYPNESNTVPSPSLPPQKTKNASVSHQEHGINKCLLLENRQIISVINSGLVTTT